MPSLPCSLSLRSALRTTRAPELHGSVCGTEVLPTVEDDCFREQMSELDIAVSRDKIRCIQGSLRKLANVTVTQISSLEGHSNQVKYLI